MINNQDAKILFYFEDTKNFPFPEDDIREWIFFIVKKEKDTAGILNFIFCSDEYLLKMNQTYLGHDTLTDIITFDYREEYNNVSGDIFISIERIKKNAAIHKVSFMQEFCRIIAHGVLHILGYDDKIEKDRNLMRDKENYYMGFFLF